MVLRLLPTVCAQCGRAQLAGVLADAHRGECHYRRMAEVMEQLDAARDELLDDEDELVGRVKDVKDEEKRSGTGCCRVTPGG